MHRLELNLNVKQEVGNSGKLKGNCQRVVIVNFKYGR